MRTVSPNALRAMLAQETGEVFLVCITISHPTFTDDFRFVNDQSALVRDAGTFQPFAFDISLPAETDDRIPEVMLTLDNLDREVIKKIRSIPAPRPRLRMEVVLASSPNTVEAGPFDFGITNINYDVGTIQGTLGYDDDLLNTVFPAGTYNPTNSQGLFR